MAKKKDNKPKEPEEKLDKAEEKEGSLFEDELEETVESETKKKSVEDIISSTDDLEEDIDDELQESDDNDPEETLEDDAEPEVKTEEEIEEEEDEEFQSGIPSEKKKSGKKIKKSKTKKEKRLVKKIFLLSLIVFALLLGSFAGVKVYDALKKKEEPKEEQIQLQPEEKDVTEEEAKEVYVTAEDGLNLREEPDASGKLVVTMPYGAKLTVLEEQGDWYKVDYNGQEGWCAKLYTSDEKPEEVWKTYTGNGFSSESPKFSVKYPSDWTLSGYKISKTDSGKTYTIALGEGGHGMEEGPGTSITTASKNVTYNGLPAKRVTAKKNGAIFFISVQFKKGNDTTQVEMSLPTGYDESYITTFDQMLETFKYL